MENEIEIDIEEIQKLEFEEQCRRYVKLETMSRGMRLALEHILNERHTLDAYWTHPLARYTHNGPASREIVEMIMYHLHEASTARKIQDIMFHRCAAYNVAKMYQHMIWYHVCDNF